MLTGTLSSTKAASNVPDWIHLLPSGTFRGDDGRGPYKLGDPAAVIAASMRDTKLPVDVNHSTDLASPRGEASPAVGWIVGMSSRADGIWGRVDWTPAGRKLLEDRAYRGISPVFEHAKDGTVQRIARAALTNVPNLPQLASLHATQAPIGSAGQPALATYQPTETDRQVCAMMGLNLQDLVDMNKRQAGVELTYGLSQTDLTVCQRMNVSPASLAAHRQLPKVDGETFGLSRQEQEVCRKMNISLMAFAAQKAARESGEQTFGLSSEEQAMCRSAKISFEYLAAWKRYGGEDPFVLALPPAARNLCDSMRMDPKDYARRYFSTPVPGDGMRVRV